MGKIKNLKSKISNNRVLSALIVIGIIVTPLLCQTSDRILFITFLALFWYAWETRGMKEEMIRQGELEQKPIMLLYVRCLTDSTDGDEQRKMRDKHREYIIYRSEEEKNIEHGYAARLLRLRNVGKAAFNVEVKSDKFDVIKYQAQFFAPEPKGDEQSIQIAKKDGRAVIWEDMNGEIFDIFCENTVRKKYGYRYKIINFEKKEVKFIKEL